MAVRRPILFNPRLVLQQFVEVELVLAKGAVLYLLLLEFVLAGGHIVASVGLHVGEFAVEGDDLGHVHCLLLGGLAELASVDGDGPVGNILVEFLARAHRHPLNPKGIPLLLLVFEVGCCVH